MSTTIENEGRERATSAEAAGWPPPHAAPETTAVPTATVPAGPVAKPRRRGRLIALAVVAALLLGGGFGIGFAVGHAAGASSVSGFDPSRMGTPLDGGVGPGGGQGSFPGGSGADQQGTTESGSGGATT